MDDRRGGIDAGQADGLAQREAFGVGAGGDNDRVAVKGGVNASLDRAEAGGSRRGAGVSAGWLQGEADQRQCGEGNDEGSEGTQN